MTAKDLFYPGLMIKIGDYIFTQGVAIETYSDSRELIDWGKVKFTKEYQPKISLSAGQEIAIFLGYGGQMDKVFAGVIIKPYNGAAGADEILFKDNACRLQRVIIHNTFRDVTPQDIIQYGLAAAGITDYQLTEDTYPQKARVPILQQDMLGVLKHINALWGINVTGGFIKGIFYWGVTPEAKIYTFTYGQNILSLSRASGLWELTTVCMPDIQPGQSIAVEHPKVSGIYPVVRMVHTTTDRGFIRCRLYF